MQHLRKVTFAILLVHVLVLFVYFAVWNHENGGRIMLFLPNATPTNQSMVIKNQRTKGCSLDRNYPCYAECCEDHWIYNRYFSNPPLCNGTYVEIGAFDGVQMSNTKVLEDALGWGGVLIEGHPFLYTQLEKNRPKSIKKQSAVCKEGVEKVNFTASSERLTGDVAYLSRILVKLFGINVKDIIEVPCKPMGKLLREAGISSIDFFSLDVEGAEMAVLETMDWNIPVRVFLVETQWIDEKAVTAYLRGKGYKAVNRQGGCKGNTVFEYEDLE